MMTKPHGRTVRTANDQPGEIKNTAQLVIVLLLTVMLSASVFLLRYRMDNKYTTGGQQAFGGLLMLTEQDLEQEPVIYLVRDWEIYRGRLLTPDDFINSPQMPDELVFIGEYGGFEGMPEDGNAVKSPHGSATYRLNLALPSATKSYTLELPEIYSAYRLYINGNLMAQMGDVNPESYHPQTGNSFVTVQASDHIEIIVNVSDYGHFYSGMVYPPAFGEPADVTQLLSTRLTLRAVADAIALCIGFLYFCVWLLTKKNKVNPPEKILPLLYSALCACFVLYTCYPVVKTLFSGGMAFYAVENVAYCAMFLFVILIQLRLSGISARRSRTLTLVSAFIGVFMCCWALLVPRFMGDSYRLMMAYSNLIGAYAWVCAGLLTATAAIAVVKGSVHSKTMLAGVVVFDCALVMDRLLPMFEPIRFGWFTELAGGLLVVLIGFIMAGEVARQFRLRLALSERFESVSHMMDMQKAYYPIILEKEEEARAAKHDLRHHNAVMKELVAAGDLEKFASYLSEYDNTQAPSVQVSYCRHYIADMLLRMYAGIAGTQDTLFHAEALLPEIIPVNDVDLCVILSNILENALEASRRVPVYKRRVSVYIRCELNRLGIIIENNFNGSFQTENGRFYSDKQSGREGIGLTSVRAVAERYGGSANFYAENDVFYSEVSLLMRKGSEYTDIAEAKA